MSSFQQPHMRLPSQTVQIDQRLAAHLSHDFWSTDHSFHLARASYWSLPLTLPRPAKRLMAQQASGPMLHRRMTTWEPQNLIFYLAYKSKLNKQGMSASARNGNILAARVKLSFSETYLTRLPSGSNCSNKLEMSRCNMTLCMQRSPGLVFDSSYRSDDFKLHYFQGLTYSRLLLATYPPSHLSLKMPRWLQNW